MSSTLYLIRMAAPGLPVAITDVAPAVAAEPSALVARAIDKLGGAKKLSDIATLSITGQHKHWDPQETPEPDVGNRLGGEPRFTLPLDIANGRARYDWVRHRIAPVKPTFIYSEVFADGTGYVLGEENIVLSRQAKETNPSLHTMSASRGVANRPEAPRLLPRPPL